MLRFCCCSSRCAARSPSFSNIQRTRHRSSTATGIVTACDMTAASHRGRRVAAGKRPYRARLGWSEEGRAHGKLLTTAQHWVSARVTAEGDGRVGARALGVCRMLVAQWSRQGGVAGCALAPGHGHDQWRVEPGGASCAPHIVCAGTPGGVCCAHIHGRQSRSLVARPVGDIRRTTAGEQVSCKGEPERRAQHRAVISFCHELNGGPQLSAELL